MLKWMVLAAVIGASIQQEPPKYEVPKLREGAHKPTLEAKLDGKWARYRFPEIPASFELPIKPEPGEKDKMMEVPNNLVGEYSDASFISPLSHYAFVVAWMKRPWTVVDFGNTIKFSFAMVPDWKDNEVTGVPRKIGTLEGYEVMARFKLLASALPKPQPTVIRVFVWRKDGLCFTLQTQYLISEEKQAMKEYERIVASFKKG